jgi:hypothetical protein
VNTANPSAEQHRAIVEGLRNITCEPGAYPLAPANVEICFAQMREALPSYRPHFRPGLREEFLLQPRPFPPTLAADNGFRGLVSAFFRFFAAGFKARA